MIGSDGLEPLTAEATTIGEVQGQIDQHSNDLEAANNKIVALETEQEILQEQIDDLNAEIVNTMASIGMMEEQLAAKESEIAAKEGEISAKVEEIAQKEIQIQQTEAEYEAAVEREESQRENMAICARLMYERGEESFLDALLEGKGLSDILNHMDRVEKIYEYENNVLTEYILVKNQVHDLWDRLVAEKESLEADRVQLETDRGQLETDRQQLQADRAELESQKANLNGMLAKKKQESANYEDELRQARKDAAAAKKLLQQDQERLKQLVLYLTNNAIAYTKAGGKVMLTVAEVRQFGQFSDFQLKVEDTGIGISREFLDHIFEPFARERNTTMSGISGIGLGLTIVKSIVDAMGGAISVDSEVGRGSAFTVTLRLRLPDSPKDAPPEEITDAAGAAEDDFKGLRILLVEDNEINLEIETEILKELDFSVDTAVNGKLAMEKIAGSAPGEYDLVLMDIQMPVMDGWQAAREIRQLNNPVPIIALSANVFESDVRKSMESGMNAHLPKPLDVEQLLETIRKVR